MLIAAVTHLPGLFGIVGSDGSHRPNVTISGNLAAVIEVVQDSELASQLMLVGRNGFPIHAQRRIAIARLEVTKNLIIGTILFDDIDDVLDGILARLEGKGVTVAAKQIAGERFIRKLLKSLLCFCNVQARYGSSDEGHDVRMLF